MIFGLGNEKGFSNYDSSSKLMDLDNSLLISVVDTPEKDLCHS